MLVAQAAAVAEHISEWKPTPVVSACNLTVEPAQRLAATLDLDDTVKAGAVLPPLWHWVYFNDWPSTADLGEDGHPAVGNFLPPIPNRRRMFAGGRVFTTTPLILELAAEKRSAVADVKVKNSGAGELLFVTIRHEFHQRGDLCLVEEQDVVYRSGETRSSGSRPTASPTEASAHWTSRPITSAQLLFRFSSLTANAHRIHYDHEYATATEGFSGLVVHGPLLALFMAELIRANAPGCAVREFDFRLRRPVIVGDGFHVQGRPEGTTVDLSVVSDRGSTHASARAQLR